MKKHILYLTQWYLKKDEAGAQRHYYNVNALIEAGYKVTVISSYVDYMNRKIPPEYIGKKFVKEVINENLNIYKIYAFPGYGKDVFSRILNMSSYAFNAFWVGILQSKTNLIIATSPPITLGLTAFFLSVFKNTPFIFEVRDLWPDSPIKMGTLKNKYLIAITRAIEFIGYKFSKAIIGLSKGICEGIKQKGINAEKVSFIPNGVDLEIYEIINQNETIIRESNDEFIAVYTGVHSTYPNLQSVLRAAEYLKDYPSIKIVLVGEGDNKPELLRMKEEMKLDNVRMFGTQSKSKIPKILEESDVCLIPYQNLEFWSGVIPNKLFDYMGASKPIITAVVKGEITDIVQDAECGICISPENPKQLAETIVWCYNNRDSISQMGKKGRNYVEEHFDRSKLTKKYVDLINRFI